MICALSVDVALEQLIDGRTALLELGEHQVALAEQIEQLMAALRQDLAQCCSLGDDGCQRLSLVADHPRDIGQTLKGAGRLADRGPVQILATDVEGFFQLRKVVVLDL